MVNLKSYVHIGLIWVLCTGTLAYFCKSIIEHFIHVNDDYNTCISLGYDENDCLIKFNPEKFEKKNNVSIKLC